MDESIHHKVDRYPARFLKQLQELRSEGDLVDVYLCVEGKEIPCHRVVLSACTDYFRAMFSGSHIESKKDKVDILGVSAEALQLLVDFAYTSEVNVTTGNVQPLYEAANMLQFEDVQDCCERFLTARLSPNTCLGSWALADKVSSSHLTKTARSYALKNFEEVCRSEEFLQLPAEFLKMYISDHGIRTKKEERVLEVIMLWARHDLEERQGHLKELMECVYFSLVDHNFLKNIMETDEVFAGVPGIKELMRDQSRHSKPHHILVFGGMTGDYTGNDRIEFENTDMYRLSLHRDCADTFPLPEAIGGSAVCVLNNDVILTGGICSRSKAWRYRSSLNSWTELEPLKTGRCWHGMAVVLGQAYAVGGFGFGRRCENVSSAEVYSEMTNSWKEIAPLALGVSFFAIAACCHRVYIFAGTVGIKISGPVTNSLQCYNPRQNVWTYAAPLPMPVEHTGITACTVNSKIYLVGGELDHIMCYSPQEDCYETMVARLGPWDQCGATVCGSEIIITGGCNIYGEDGEDIPTRAVQYYNVSSNTIWMDEDKLPVPLLEHKVVTLLKH